MQYGILLMMLALAAGLWRLQVLGASNFRVLAEQNRIRKVPILAARGKLFDRENRLIVDNYPSVSCFLVREQNHNVDADLPLIAHGLNLDLNQLRATLQHYRLSPGYQPIPIKQDITADEQAFIEAHRNELPELETIDEERRLYPRDGFAAHLIGYVGEVSEDMLNNPRYAAYEPGDVVGKAGVEETYDQLLRGQDGSRDVIVDSHGREVGYLGIQHANPGQDLRLTIDNDLQRAAELALGDRDGAIVAMDPRNGEILAMVSRPSFDPNEFAVRINRADWNKLITDPRASADEQGHPGAACAGVDVQDPHVGGRACRKASRRTCTLSATAAGPSTGTSTTATSTTARWISTTPFPTPATRSSTRWATSWASTASPSTPRNSASARRPASTCPASSRA